jgi:Fe-S cluster biogenesis protein NfuA
MEKLNLLLCEITQGLQSDGADLDVVSSTENSLTLRFNGKSTGLSSVKENPKEFIKKLIQKEIPSIETVEFL